MKMNFSRGVEGSLSHLWKFGRGEGGQGGGVPQWNSLHGGVWIFSGTTRYDNDNRQIKIHVYAKRQTWLCTTWPSFSPYFPFTVYCFYTKISSFMPALSIRIALDCFYLLIFYSEKFSTDVCRLPYAVNVNLNLSNDNNNNNNNIFLILLL